MADKKLPKLNLDDFMPYRLAIAANAVGELIARAYQNLFALNINEWRMIALLGDANGLTQRELGERARLDKVTISRAAHALEARELVVRVVNAEDGRSWRLALTTEGRRLYEAVVPAALSFESEILGMLNMESGAQLNDLLRRIENVAETLKKQSPHMP